MFRASVPKEFKRIVTKKAVELGGSLQGLEDNPPGQISFTVSLNPEELASFKAWFAELDFNPENYKFCSFCGAAESDVGTLISGPQDKLYICDECVVLCNSIVNE